jgi:hypothetical protein
VEARKLFKDKEKDKETEEKELKEKTTKVFGGKPTLIFVASIGLPFWTSTNRFSAMRKLTTMVKPFCGRKLL